MSHQVRHQVQQANLITERHCHREALPGFASQVFPYKHRFNFLFFHLTFSTKYNSREGTSMHCYRFSPAILGVFIEKTNIYI